MPAPSTRLALLGPPALQPPDSPPVPLGWSRTTALLAYLACQRGPVGRDTLAALLRPDDAPDSARAYLRRLVHRTREAHPAVASALEADGERIAWTGGSDVRDLLDACDRSAFEAALELHAAPLLQGAGSLGDEGLDAWLDDERARLRQRWRAALMGAVRRASQPSARAAWLQRLLDDDPLDEDAVRFALHQARSPAEADVALGGYEILQRGMALELGVKPQADTSALAEALKARSAAPEAAAPLAPKADPDSQGDGRPHGGLLLGRAADLEAVLERLTAERPSFVTLLGPGGVGKTELALAVADRLQAAGETVYWATLTAETPATLAATIAQAVRLTPHEGPLEAQLLARLRHLEGTLLLDNFETVASEAPRIAQWAAASPRLRWLVTSREALGLPVEQRHALAGLSTTGSESAAVTLFRHHAQRLGADGDDPASACAIVELLDGLPLGIELAASWLPLLSPREILEELRQDLGRLEEPAGVRREGHRSLRAVFDTSWRLLDESERRALGALTVFPGAFDRADAQRIAGCSAATLLRLVSKSTVHRRSDGRLVLHSALRQLAAQAVGADTLAAPRERHMQRHMELLAEGSPVRFGHVEESRLRALRERQADLDAAWRAAVEFGAVDRMIDALPNLTGFLQTTGRHEELVALAGLVEDALPDGHEHRHAFASARAIGMVFGSRLEAGGERVLALLRTPGQHALMPDLHFAHCFATAASGRHADAAVAAQRAVEVARMGGNAYAAIRALWVLGTCEFVAGRSQAAEHAFADMLQRAIEVGSDSLQAQARLALGDLLVFQGRQAEGLPLLRRAATYFESTGDPVGQSYARRHLAYAYRRAGAHAQALDAASSALQAANQVHTTFNQVACRTLYAQALADMQFLEEAQAEFAAALHAAVEQRFPALALRALIGLCAVDRTLQRDDAARLLAGIGQRPELRPWDRLDWQWCAQWWELEPSTLTVDGEPPHDGPWPAIQAMAARWLPAGDRTTDEPGTPGGRLPA